MNWHRLFGLMLTDFFTDSPFIVELEKDLSLKKQFLDVVILRREQGCFAGRLPDRLDDLAAHNLITFKSHQEALDDWALKELTGHYVNYRKQVTAPEQPLLPESEFQLYAVCSRYPHNLANDLPLEQVRPGVYRCRRGSDLIRVVVAGRLPKTAHNAMLHLFGASAAAVGFGAQHYRRRSQETSTLLEQLFQGYQREGMAMPYTMADWKRDYITEHFKELTPEDRRKALEGLSPKERLEGLSPEELLEGLSPDAIEKLLKKLRASGPSRQSRPRRKK